MSLKMRQIKNFKLQLLNKFNTALKAGVCCTPCKPSKWEAEFCGWLEVWRPALLCFIVNQCSVRLLIAWSLWGNPGMGSCWRKSDLSCSIHPAAQSTLGEQQWDSLVSEHSVGFQIKICRPKLYAGKRITGLGVRNNSDGGLAKLPCLEPAVILQ